MPASTCGTTWQAINNNSETSDSKGNGEAGDADARRGRVRLRQSLLLDKSPGLPPVIIVMVVCVVFELPAIRDNRD